MNLAFYKNIRGKIIEQISSAKKEIKVCVAWFTSKEILGKLIDKLETGCKVEIIISDHYENKRLDYRQFIKNGGVIKILSSNSGRFLHDKFALFDNNKLITGSYNWTNSAEFYNHEYIVISDNETLLKQFTGRFKYLTNIVENYEIEKLQNIVVFDSDSKEEEFEKLEKELFDELIKSIDASLDAGAKINKSTILDLLHRYGAIGTTKRLVKEGAKNLQSGLIKMFEINRLDLTFENIILHKKYRALFDETTLSKAKEKLEKLNYKSNS
ncbi:phospholipase D-like domain-containing protein [Tenacibaculum sp. XPcli2-G]|uniref:phospholipase D-like domain-containing protein n=1 Tax=Tenacibaculum sp. XPcli2-G TaxID=2954503 RepID=UPI002096CE48|nr:phospholipase D-like domain-containing protein [Tenacibaculum sp. XPcli2-G]MCO7186727.1 phospholipase D-like domain-containing protein [Tenacibaculum sp. XPcli2-G]